MLKPKINPEDRADVVFHAYSNPPDLQIGRDEELEVEPSGGMQDLHDLVQGVIDEYFPRLTLFGTEEVVRVYLKGEYNQDELSRQLGVSVNTVRRRLKVGLETLKTGLSIKLSPGSGNSDLRAKVLTQFASGLGRLDMETSYEERWDANEARYTQGILR
jgi:hypothetical protein